MAPQEVETAFELGAVLWIGDEVGELKGLDIGATVGLEVVVANAGIAVGDAPGVACTQPQPLAAGTNPQVQQQEEHPGTIGCCGAGDELHTNVLAPQELPDPPPGGQLRGCMHLNGCAVSSQLPAEPALPHT